MIPATICALVAFVTLALFFSWKTERLRAGHSFGEGEHLTSYINPIVGKVADTSAGWMLRLKNYALVGLFVSIKRASTLLSSLVMYLEKKGTDLAHRLRTSGGPHERGSASLFLQDIAKHKESVRKDSLDF